MWFKSKKRQRLSADEAAERFTAFVPNEGMHLRSRIGPILSKCLFYGPADTVDRAIPIFADGDFKKEIVLVDVACTSAVYAIGLHALYDLGDYSYSLIRYVHSAVSREIARAEVGKNYVGSMPSPRLPNGSHVTWSPGTLSGADSPTNVLKEAMFGQMSYCANFGIDKIEGCAQVLFKMLSLELDKDILVGSLRHDRDYAMPESLPIALNADLYGFAGPETVQAILKTLNSVSPFWSEFFKSYALTDYKFP